MSNKISNDNLILPKRIKQESYVETPSSISTLSFTASDSPCSDATPPSTPRIWDRRLHEIKLCLLICTMFPKHLPFQHLFIFGMGLELFGNVDNLLHVRYWMHDLIQNIINLGVEIVLSGDQDEDPCVKVIGSLGSTSQVAYRYRLIVNHDTVIEEWSNTDSYQNCDGLSLVLYRIKEYPVILECPNLAILHIQYEEDSLSLPVDFFQGMKQLRVLSLNVPTLPQSLDVLSNLRTLRLKVVTSENMSAIGHLINLEFLSISTISLTDIPNEMGQLVHLRSLDLRKVNLAYLPPFLLWRMSKLEELYLPLSFKRWDCSVEEKHGDYDEWESREDDNYDHDNKTIARRGEVNDGERRNASLIEILSPSLNALQFRISEASVLPKESPIFRNLQRFKIVMEKNLKDQPFGKGPMAELQLGGDAHDIKESGICDLLCRTENLSLTRVRNLKNVVYQLEDDGFPQLKKMIIAECDELEYLIDTTEKQNGFSSFWELEILHLSMLSEMKEIWHGTRPVVPWLGNLRKINIRFCHKLKYVFPLSIANGLIRLKSIEILNCYEIEEIFCIKEVDDSINDQEFALEELHLHALPKLVGFLVHTDDTTNVVYDVPLSNVDAATSQSLTTNEVESNDTKGQVTAVDVEVQTPSRTSRLKNKLKKLRLFNHQPVPNKQVLHETPISNMEMYSAFSSKLMEKRLERLEKLKISLCPSLEVIFSFNKNHATSIEVLNSLKELELYGLQNLVHIWFQFPQGIIGFQNLQLLALSECHNLYVLSPRVAKLLVRLQKLQISRCEKIEEIIVKEDGNEIEEMMDKKIIFPELKSLEFQYMVNLKIFYGGICEIELPLLESLKLNQCNKMESFSYGSLSTPMLKTVQINGSSCSLTRDVNATMKRSNRRRSKNW